MRTERTESEVIIIAANLVAAGGDRGNLLMDDPEINRAAQMIKAISEKKKDTPE